MIPYKKYKSNDLYWKWSLATSHGDNVPETANWVKRTLIIYDYIIISDNNYENILENLKPTKKLNILIIEKNKKPDVEAKSENNMNLHFKYEKELLSIEKYYWNKDLYMVFLSDNINYLCENIMFAPRTNITNLRFEELKCTLNNIEQSNLDRSITYLVKFDKTKNSYKFYDIDDKLKERITILSNSKYTFEIAEDCPPFNMLFLRRSRVGSQIAIKSSTSTNLINNSGSISKKGENLQFTTPKSLSGNFIYMNYNEFKLNGNYYFLRNYVVRSMSKITMSMK